MDSIGMLMKGKAEIARSEALMLDFYPTLDGYTQKGNTIKTAAWSGKCVLIIFCAIFLYFCSIFHVISINLYTEDLI